MAKEKLRVLAEDSTVLEHRKEDGVFEFETEDCGFNIDALIAGGLIERVQSKPNGSPEEK